MDTIHFSPEINRRMLDKIIAGEDEMTPENYERVLEGVREFTDDVVNDYIIPYEEQGLLHN